MITSEIGTMGKMTEAIVYLYGSDLLSFLWEGGGERGRG